MNKNIIDKHNYYSNLFDYYEVEIDIDFWPQIPAYVEFEAENEQLIKNLCYKLNIDFNQLVSIDVEKIYNQYGLDFKKNPIISLKDEIKKKNVTAPGYAETMFTGLEYACQRLAYSTGLELVIGRASQQVM